MKLKNILIILLCVLLSVLLVYIVQSTENERNAVTNRMVELQEIARPYEKQLAALKASMATIESEMKIAYAPQRGRVLVGFELSSYSDLKRVRTICEQYGFQPVLVVDCTMDESVLAGIIDTSANAYFEVAFTAPSLNAESFEAIEHFRQLMEGSSLIDTGTFVLSGANDTEDNLDLLVENGFNRCFRFQSNYDSEVLESGLVCVGYSYVNSKNISLKSNLQNAALVKRSSMYLFNFANWPEDLNSNTLLYSFLDNIISYTGDGSLLASTLGDTFDEVYNYALTTAEVEAENEAIIAKQQEKIDALEKVILSIYADDGSFTGEVDPALMMQEETAEK